MHISLSNLFFMAHRAFGEGPRGPSNFLCTICRTRFKQPKILNCYHMFCMDCLKEHVKKFCRNGLFPCPICKVLIPLPVWGGLEAFETIANPLSSNIHDKVKWCWKKALVLQFLCDFLYSVLRGYPDQCVHFCWSKRSSADILKVFNFKIDCDILKLSVAYTLTVLNVIKIHVCPFARILRGPRSVQELGDRDARPKCLFNFIIILPSFDISKTKLFLVNNCYWSHNWTVLSYPTALAERPSFL